MVGTVTVTGVSIITPGLNYQTTTGIKTYNQTHGSEETVELLYVDITTNNLGEVITATPTVVKSGFNFAVNDRVFVVGGNNKCVLQITSVEP